MNRILYIFTIGFLFSCNSKTNQSDRKETVIIHDTVRIIENRFDTVFIEKQNDYEISDFYIHERLPEWFLKTDLINGIKIKEKYQIDNRLNPLYLEGDFNGDGHIDLAIPIKELESEKVGFAVIHGETNEIFIVGAGTKIKKGLSDNMNYVDIWKVNRNRKNEPGLDENGNIDKNEPLILKNPSIQIEKSEVGGGQVYWNGVEYEYFHQTC